MNHPPSSPKTIRTFFIFLFIIFVTVLVSFTFWIEAPSTPQSKEIVNLLDREYLKKNLRNVSIACRFYAKKGCLTDVHLDPNSNQENTKATYRTLYYRSYPFSVFLNTLIAQHRFFGGSNNLTPSQIRYLKSFTHYNYFKNISPAVLFVLLNLEGKLAPLTLAQNPSVADLIRLNVNIILTSNKLSRLLAEEKGMSESTEYITVNDKSKIAISRPIEPESRALLRYLFENVARSPFDYLNLAHNFALEPFPPLPSGDINRSYAASQTYTFGANAMTPLDYKNAVIEREY